MIEIEQLAEAFDPNMGDSPVQKRTWDQFAGKATRMRTVPWYRVAAQQKQNAPPSYSSSVVASIGGMIPSQIPTDGEIGTPLVKTATGAAFERLRLLE